MIRLFYIALLAFWLVSTTAVYAQQKQPVTTSKDSLKIQQPNFLAPSRAAFYSAILPGLGQAYNKKYWKIPLVYAALGTTVYAYIFNNNKYHDYRDAYKSRLLGQTGDQFAYLDTPRLIKAQQFHQRNRDLSALLIGVFYVLNIVEANVDAHLMQFNVSDKLTVQPNLIQNEITQRQNLGFGVSFQF